ncbi:hypothetical protein OGZ39_11975 [Lactococcus lactis]|uniref:Uncharacterized protein n=1 Tax=Lactococcus lactis TaxID=1358 RepID=A0A9X4S2Y4_9LACT|nr:hypothetical protein [Lactococcus lactis]MDG4982355.1 hypothetical protein [Lactococcus lactis]THA51332.1 hypothetical protein E5555_11100 [Lactococcus lactis]
MFIENIKGGCNGKQWEDLCIQAYTIQYSEYHFTEIPARNQGDGGIEGFTSKDKGIAIQCYYPENNFTFQELYNHQVNKITHDINRLLDETNAKKNLKKMGICPIKEWHFLVPEYSNKDLIKHADKKSREVREKIKQNRQLYDYLDDDFTIFLCTEKHIAKYLTDIILSENSAISLDIELVDEKKIDWQTEDNKIYDNISRKVSKLSDIEINRKKMVDMFMKSYVSGVSELLEISAISTKIYSKIANLIDEYTNKVQLESLMNSGGAIAYERYKELNSEFLRAIDQELHFLNVTSRQRLGRQVMARWLGDCPLEF